MTTPATEPQPVIGSPVNIPQLFKYLGLMTGAHLLAIISFASPFFELTNTGAVSFIPFLCLIIGSIALYLAVFNAAVRGRAGKKAFMVAAVLLAAFFWKWYVPSLVATVAYGALLAVGGLRLSYMKAAA